MGTSRLLRVHLQTHLFGKIEDETLEKHKLNLSDTSSICPLNTKLPNITVADFLLGFVLRLLFIDTVRQCLSSS